MDLRGCLAVLSALFAVACGNTVEGGGSGRGGGQAATTASGGESTASGGGQSAGLCSESVEPAEGFPLIVQTQEDGRVRLLLSNRHLTCSLSEHLDIYLFQCDGFVAIVDMPASALTPGTVVQDGVAGSSIFWAEAGAPDPPGGSSCSASVGPAFAMQITILDVSRGAITAQVSGSEPFAYAGVVDGTYVGPDCGPIAHPLPNPGAGTARAWGSDPVTIVVSSAALDCNEPAPGWTLGCPSWQYEVSVPASVLVPGTRAGTGDAWFNAKGCPYSSEPGDCPSGGGSPPGETTIGAVSASAIELTLDHFDDGITALGINGVYQAVRCP